MRPTRTVLFDTSSPFQTTLDALDLTELRRAYSALFDRAATEVFRRGLDLDDVVVERFVVCRRADGETTRTPLTSLADRSAVVRCLAGGAGAATGSIVEIGAVVLRETPPPVGSGGAAG